MWDQGVGNALHLYECLEMVTLVLFIFYIIKHKKLNTNMLVVDLLCYHIQRIYLFYIWQYNTRLCMVVPASVSNWKTKYLSPNIEHNWSAVWRIRFDYFDNCKSYFYFFGLGWKWYFYDFLFQLYIVCSYKI